MANHQREAASLVHSTAALRDRATKAGLSTEEVEAIITSNVNSMAQMAFAITPPGTAPSEQEVRDFFHNGFHNKVPVNLGTVTSTKLLVFECHTLVVANIKAEVNKKDDSTTQSTLPTAERDRRIADQRQRLAGLRLKGDEEVAHSSYDLAFTMLEKDTITYLHREKFVTRRAELLQKRPMKQLALDQDSLTVREKLIDMTCSTRTELELVQAFRRRALAFDLVGLAAYELMNSYHAELLSHMQEDPPPGYTQVSVTQVLRADRAVFLHLAENMTTLKCNVDGELPFEKELMPALARPNVSFHLLPLAASAPARPAPKANPNNANKRKHDEQPKPAAAHPKSTPRAKGKGKGKSKRKGRGPNVPKELVGKALETNDGHRICWPFNMQSGCQDAAPGGQCQRGAHVCAEPGCGKPHSLLSHKTA